ncbi:Gfo/Idh/MocA family protein [Jannaschia sp. CCS1]|uniref:Gfo/Idh/MocA family protein n=1 Tax=Jannaschia sp. (strain CCS1) TaxID=290400 RepID=UPI00006C00C7|nr:Gfo/Idh/MocA family oxidoreductase [Jannaschia sp. CCS1]ABD56315.1 oxidoreductase-like protein [Jannaschia sp. CCS1]
MTKHLTWGILGTARFALGTMAPAIHAARRAHLKSVATRNPDRAAPFVEKFPRITVEPSYEAILNDPEIDAVYIPLPNALHTEWSIKAAQAGKHVLCEKPIGLNAGDIDRLTAARDATGKLIAEAWMPAHHPQWARARDMLADGAIGALKTVTGSFTFGGLPADNIRLNRDLGGGALFDIGVYPIGGFRFATGLEPVPVHVDWGLENGVDTSAWVAMRAGDVRFNFHVSMRTTKHQHMTFDGTDATLTLTMPFNAHSWGEAEMHLMRSEAEAEVIRFPAVDQYIRQVEAVSAHVLDGAPFGNPLEFTQGTQAALDAIFAMGHGGPAG